MSFKIFKPLLFACVLSLFLQSSNAQVKQWISKAERDKVVSDNGGTTSSIPDFRQKSFSQSPNSGVGVSTGVWGFFDFQSYGAPCEYIEVNPSSPNHIHAMMTIKYDSGDGTTSPSRRASYSYSSDGGVSWSAVASGTQTYLPNDSRRSGFGSLQLFPGEGRAAIVTQAKTTTVGSATQTIAFYDTTEGANSFNEYPFPIYSTGTDQPIWAHNIFTSSGYMGVAAGRVNAQTLHFARMAPNYYFENFSSAFPLGDDRRSMLVAGSNGRLALIVYSSTLDGLYYLESIDEGGTWGSPLPIYEVNISNGDTLAAQWTGFDALYIGTNLYVTFGVGQAVFSGGIFSGIAVNDNARIMLWNREDNVSTVVMDKNNVPGVMLDSILAPARAQFNHGFALNFPTIGLNPNGKIIIACDYFQQSVVDTGNWNYSDILLTSSSDTGATWRTPMNITNTPTLDERYVGISKWNPNDWAYLQFQEDTQPGTSFQDDNRPVTRTYQKFLKVSLTGQSIIQRDNLIPEHYSLAQNYPNPFNPTTSISFSVSATSNVVIKVMNITGEEIATLVNEKKEAGNYSVPFNAENLPSGIYFYMLRTETFSDVKKMLLLK